MSSQNIHLYLTSEHDCGYLPDRMATNLVPDPTRQMDMALYSQLIQLGYRRSGDFTYRPHCNDCAACLPCRVPVAKFTPNRSQRRCLKDNLDLTTNIVRAEYSDEHFELYRTYINSRHSDGSMVDPEPQDFSNFLFSPWSDTHFLEVRKDNRLVAVAAFDRTDSALSAVYCYFDPEESTRSLGTYCILQQIEQTKTMGLDHLYMGYWIKDCQKMNYKVRFQPMEIFANNTWVLMDASD
jgi:arginine-tRNA-protein transferase